MRVLIVEDQAMLRESLGATIGAEADMEVAGLLSDAEEAVGRVCELAPDLALMDVCTENDSSGIVAARKMKELLPSLRVVVMTGMPDVTFVRQARDAGVESFVYKNVGTQELLSVLRSTHQGYCTYPSAAHAGGMEVFGQLTDQEVAIVRLVCEARSRQEIARELLLSEGTLKRRISEILAKTGYTSILKLAVSAVAQGYIVPGLSEQQPH